MSCMSAYSMPLCTILTKWPAPSWPTCVTHGSPSATAAMDLRIGPRVTHDSSEPPGMIDGPLQRAFLAAGDTHADEVDAGLADRLLAADRVGEQGVAAVDDDVARLEHAQERVDDGIRRAARLDHDDRRAGLRQVSGELLVRERGDELGLGVLGDEFVGLGAAAVEHRDRVALAAGEVAGEVRPHHREADDADVRRRGARPRGTRRRRSRALDLLRSGSALVGDGCIRPARRRDPSKPWSGWRGRRSKASGTHVLLDGSRRGWIPA